MKLINKVLLFSLGVLSQGNAWGATFQVENGLKEDVNVTIGVSNATCPPQTQTVGAKQTVVFNFADRCIGDACFNQFNIQKNEYGAASRPVRIKAYYTTKRGHKRSVYKPWGVHCEKNQTWKILGEQRSQEEQQIQPLFYIVKKMKRD